MAHHTEYNHLIALICAAEDAPLFSPEAWQAYLGSETETARAFCAQLKREWQPVYIPSALCQTVMGQAQAHLAGISLPWRNLWAHMLRVTGNTLMLAESAEITAEEAFLLGILHDVGKLDELQHGAAHELVGALIAEQWLSRYESELSAQIIERLIAAIAKRGAQADPFVKVLHDADKLDKIGATGILRRLSSYLGKQNPAVALRIVMDDVARFPQLHYPASMKLAKLKRDFTAVFLARAMAPVR
jgi:HD superfamily phosphodiesterase